MHDSDEAAVTGVSIRIGGETMPEKQTVRYLGGILWGTGYSTGLVVNATRRLAAYQERVVYPRLA